MDIANRFDRLVIGVPALPTAIEQYQQLLGSQPLVNTTEEGESAAWWGLSNTVIELVQRPLDKACIQDIVFSSSGTAGPEQPVANRLGLNICLGNGERTAALRRRQGADPSLSVDHLVLRTDDAQACVELFGDELGIRLALDKTVPEWGGRMLFFRTGKLTLEVIQAENEEGRGSFFWGIAYQCPNLEQIAGNLAARGVLLSDIREGRKPGTRVATIKSHCLEIPTLLVQPST